MIDELFAMYDKNLDYARRLTGDLSEAQLTAQPAAAATPMNHAAWVLGHLAFVADFYAGSLGAAPTAPKDWAGLFGMNSKPQSGALYGTRAALTKALEDAHVRMKELIRAKPDDYWRQPPADERRRQRFATNGHMLVHMLVNHEAVHLGQLSAWRRAQGLPGV